PAVDRACKRVPDAVSGSDEHVRVIVAQRPPDFLDQPEQRGVRDERAGPQILVNLRLGHHGRRPLDQEHQEIEGLWREVRFRSVAFDALDPKTRRPAAGSTRPTPRWLSPRKFATSYGGVADDSGFSALWCLGFLTSTLAKLEVARFIQM